jgi:hypothetical protein
MNGSQIARLQKYPWMNRRGKGWVWTAGEGARLF